MDAVSPQNDSCQPLDATRREIRVLTIALPFVTGLDDADTISCSLEVTSLDEAHMYNALSYEWGDASKTSTIVVDGHPIQVTANLEQALRNICNFHREFLQTPMWVDAVCINQADDAERAGQVQLMSAIFHNAARVLLWLDFETDFSLSRSNRDQR